MTRFQFSFLFLAAVILGFVVFGAVALAWTNPTQNPPGGNVAAPVNIGGTSQTKSGSFFSSATVGGATVNATSSLCIAGDCKTAWSQVGGSQWTTQGSDIYYTAGSVSIGTTATSSQLHVFNSTGDNILKLSRGASTSTILRVGTDGGLVVQNQSSDVLTIKSGNVGIGTTSPGQKLEIVGGNIKLSNTSDLTLSIGKTGTNGAGVLAANSAQLGINFDSNGKFVFGSSARSDIDAGVYSGTDLVTILSSGNVGIGTTGPGTYDSVPAKVEIESTTHAGLALDSAVNTLADLMLVEAGTVKWHLLNRGDSGDRFELFEGGVGARVTVLQGGNVGIGTTAPGNKLEIVPNGGWVSIPYQASKTDGYKLGLGNFDGYIWRNYVSGYFNDLIISTNFYANDAGTAVIPNSGARTNAFRMGANGNFVFQTGDTNTAPTTKMTIANNGNITFSNYTAGNCCSDIAEYYPSSEPVEAADVMAVDRNGPTGTVKKAQAGDTIIGIVSTNPAIVIEEKHFLIAGGIDNYVANPTKPVIALAGRVPVKVSLENGPIKAGDRLTVSSVPGVAMKATKAGMTIGIALEPLENINSGSYAKISAFVNISYWMPE